MANKLKQKRSRRIQAGIPSMETAENMAARTKRGWLGLSRNGKLLIIGIIALVGIGVLGSGLKYLEASAKSEIARRAVNQGQLNNNAETSWLNTINPFLPAPLPSPTPQLAKEYIYAGSRMLAVEDANASVVPTPTPAVCTPFTTVTEGDLYPGGISVFGVTSGANSVVIDHIDSGTGLQSLTVVSSTNETVNIPTFTVGTYDPVTVTFTIIDPNQAVDFTLRGANTYHAIFIRVRCNTPYTAFNRTIDGVNSSPLTDSNAFLSDGQKRRNSDNPTDFRRADSNEQLETGDRDRREKRL